jgi:hypothetical protein
MGYTERFTEQYQLGAVEYPDSLGAGTTNGTWLSMADAHRAFFLLLVGDIAATGTVDFLLQQATDAAGTGAKAIAGKAITQLTQAGGDSDDACGIELQAEELDVSGGFDYVRWQLTRANAAAELAVAVFLGEPMRFQPTVVTAWTEIIT